MPLDPNPGVTSVFVISLDFELHWGVRDTKSVAQYRENLLGVRRVVPALLELFSEYQIHATWATVGFLFFGTRKELFAAIPDQKPGYDDERLSPYLDMQGLGRDEDNDPFHFGRNLIEQIKAHPEQEIATHTFSHYYCLESRQNLEAFRSDLRAACMVARELGITFHSIVFPRNQYDSRHLEVCRQVGLTAFRGNQNSWLHRPRATSQENWLQRSARIVDSYLGLSGRHSYPFADVEKSPLVNLPASRFLRPWMPRIPGLQALQEKRILAELAYAAERGLVYHLWWHPHNFGAHPQENLASLRKILDHFQIMRERYGMQSRSMAELASVKLSSPWMEDNGQSEEENRAVRKAG
jgi:peptidoglycan/xylan/chitin deacetylase (PgdA/CDA1 family)